VAAFSTAAAAISVAVVVAVITLLGVFVGSIASKKIGGDAGGK